MAGYCVKTEEAAKTAAPEGLTPRQRRARGVAGIGFLALAAGLAWGGFALEALAAGALAVLLCAIPCLLAIVAGWFGLSHVVAAFTAYPGCPEIGAIRSLFTRKPVRTGCTPWDRIDRRLNHGVRSEI